MGSGKKIGNVREIKGLHYFDDGTIQEKQVQLVKKVPSVLGLNKARIADGSFSPIARKGEITLTPTLTLSSVLHVPKLSCNLFSVGKFT